MILLILLVAPILQIVLSLLRIRDKISTPIGVIALFMIILGFVLSYIGQIIAGNDAPPGEARGTISFAFLFIGNLVTIILALIIAIISSIVYYSPPHLSTGSTFVKLCISAIRSSLGFTLKVFEGNSISMDSSRSFTKKRSVQFFTGYF
jgi:uncharacterized membrane protein